MLLGQKKPPKNTKCRLDLYKASVEITHVLTILAKHLHSNWQNSW